MNKKQLIENLVYYIELFENEKGLEKGLLFSRSGNLWNACLQFVQGEYISVNKNALLMKDNKPSEYSLFKVSAFFDVYESLCFNYDFVCRPSGFCNLTGINRSTLERWGRAATTEYREVPLYNNIDNSNIYNNRAISLNHQDISSNNQTISNGKDISTNNEAISNTTLYISNHQEISPYNTSAQKSQMVSLVSTDVYKKILFSNLETVTNKMQGGEGNTVGFITEYNAVREDIQERTDTGVEVVADVKAIATRYGIVPQIEDNKQGVGNGIKMAEALLLQGLQGL